MTQSNDLNPWLTIWRQPRNTMRYLIENNPTHHIKLLAGLIGVADAGLAVSNDQTIGAISLILFLGWFGGLFDLYLYGLLLRWVGGWFGGLANPLTTRAAYAWPNLPLLIAVILFWLPNPLVALIGFEMDEISTLAITMLWISLMALDLGGFLSALSMFSWGLWAIIALYSAIAIGIIGLLIYTYILSLKCLSEVHQFSTWKAFITIVVVEILIIIATMPICGDDNSGTFIQIIC